MIFFVFFGFIFLSYGEFKLREMQLRLQVLQAARRLSRAVRVEPCHWLEGYWDVTAGNASHNASNARGVTGMERNSSRPYT